MNVLEAMEIAYSNLQNRPTSSGRQYWFHKMLALYKANKTVQKVWEYIDSARLLINRFVKKCAAAIVYQVKHDYPKGSQLVYLIRLLNESDKLIWSKVGTTTRAIDTRMREHLRYYKKNGVTKVEVSRIYNCGTLPAEGLESEFRAKYMCKYPGTFQKNDRFTAIEFDLNEADEIANNYLGTVIE